MMWPEACFMLLQSSLYSLLDGEQVLFSFWELNKKQYEGFEFYQIFLAILLLLVPPALEFPVIHRHITPVH